MKAKLTIGFERAGTPDRGVMTFEGDAQFLETACAGLSYLISHLSAAYGADQESWTTTVNELMEAWQAAKEGQGYTGSIVKITFKEAK